MNERTFAKIGVNVSAYRQLERELRTSIVMRRQHRRTRRGRHSSLEVRKSGVHGRGVFATRPIRKGNRIIEYTGRRIPWSSVPEDLDDERTYYFGLDNGKEVIDPAINGNEAKWINHSCDPNCEAVENSQGRVFIYALRNLRPGEELFYDYRLEVDVPRTKEVEKENRCTCGSEKCRGTMLNPK